MSVTELPPTTEQFQAEITDLRAQLASLQKPSRASVASNFARRVGKGVIAAVASTDAVKQEKSLAVTIAVRLLISAGAAEGTVKLAQTLLKTAGWS